MSRRTLSLLAAVVVLAVFAALAIRQLQFAAHSSVNVLVLDQWDFYTPLFKQQGWWATFDYQHGPHRQGVGMLVTRVLAGITGWNSRWDAIACSGLLILGGALALAVARRFGPVHWPLGLLAVPLIFFNVHQFEIFVGPSNLSHGAMPVLLFMAFCWVQLLRDCRLRLGLGAVLTFGLIFTGFGIFVGVLAPVVTLIELIQASTKQDSGRARWAGGALAINALSWGFFAQGYTFQPAVAGFRFPYEHPSEYLVFVARMFGNFFGLGGLTTQQLIIGGAAVAIMVGLAAVHGWRCATRGVSSEPRSAVLFFLSAYVLLYVANTAVGRVFIGPEAPLAPRYVTLLIPGALAIYLQLTQLPGPRLGMILRGAYVALLIPATAIWSPAEAYTIPRIVEARRVWKRVYLRTHDQLQADRESGVVDYPGDLTERLKFLEQHRLNLFVP